MSAACWLVFTNNSTRVSRHWLQPRELRCSGKEANSINLRDSWMALSPLAILDRGYALVFDPSGALLKDAGAVKPGDEISARLAKGSLSATVNRRKQK